MQEKLEIESSISAAIIVQKTFCGNLQNTEISCGECFLVENMEYLHHMYVVKIEIQTVAARSSLEKEIKIILKSNFLYYLQISQWFASRIGQNNHWNSVKFGNSTRSI